MRYTSHLLVIWEAKSRILFSKYSQTMLLCKDVGIFEVCIRRSPNTYKKSVESDRFFILYHIRFIKINMPTSYALFIPL